MNKPPKYYDGYTEYGDDNIGPRLCDAAGGLEAVREKYGFIPWVCVEGYDTSLSTDQIKELLTEHFSECGRIDEIDVPSDNKSCAYIYLAGKGSSQKAVDLTGTEVGGRKIVVSFANLPLNPTLSSTQGPYCGIGTTFPAYASRNNTVTDWGPYGNTLPGQRIVAESKNFPLPTFGSGTTFPAYVSDRPWNSTITDCGNTLPGQRIVADPKNLPEVPRCTFGIGSTVPADTSKKAEKMTEE